MPPIPDDELLRLASAWFDGATTPEEQAELDRRLVADPQAAAVFARIASLDGHLRERFRAGAAAHAAGTSTITGSFPARSRGWPVPVALAVAAALLLCVAAAWWWPRGSAMPVIEVADGVEVVRAGQVVAVTSGSRLRAGDIVRTSAGGSAVLAWGENGRAELGPAVEVALAPARERRLDLHRGALALAGGLRGLRIATPHATLSDGAGAVGDYQVVVEARRTRVDVVSGSLAMAAIGSQEALSMNAGDGAEMASGAPRPRLIDNRLVAPERLAPALAASPLRRMAPQALDWKRAGASGSGRWLPGDGGVRQTAMTPWDPTDANTPTPLYEVPIAPSPGGVLVRAVVTEEGVAAPGRPNGFGVVLGGHDGTRLLAIKRVNWNGRVVLAVRSGDQAMPRPGSVANVASTPSGRYRIEVALERQPGQGAWLRARLWPADAPTPDWMVGERLPVDCDPRRLGLLTFRAVCAFSEVEVHALATADETPPVRDVRRPF